MRAILKRCHLTLGLILALPLTLIGVTGSLLAISEPVAQSPAAHHRTAHHHGARVDVDAIVRAAAATVPAGLHVATYTAPGTDTPARVAFAGAHSQRSAVQVYVDAASLAVTPVSPRPQSFYSVVHGLHETLLAGAAGRTIVGWLGVGLLVLVITGPIVWWPGRTALRTGLAVRRDAGAFRFARDIHRAIGVWAFAFLIVLSVTGISIVYPAPVGRTIGLLFPSRAIWTNDVPLAAHARDAKPMATSAAVALAQRAAGPGRIRAITFGPDRAPLRIDLAPAGIDATAIVTVLIDPYAQRVLDVRDPQRFSFGERLITALRPLHEGHILGTPWRIALVIIGLCPPFFAVTGLTMWYLRGRRHAAKALAYERTQIIRS